jgi:flagellar biosynthesis/type III secretory pathway protein FliH
LFNQPHPARAAVPWQPHAGIAQKLSSRGYATTRWGSEEPEDFADLGFPAKTSGFSADHYQPMRQPLSKQAQASLAMLEDAYRNESLGEEQPESQTSTATNDHLPFVSDQFAATRKSKLRVQVDPRVLQRALAHAELAETLKVSPITTDEKVADPIVIHPDVPDEDSLQAQDATDFVATVADTEVADESVAAADKADQAEAEADAEADDEAPLAAATVEEELVDPTPAAPALPAVVGGVPPEEVAQRETEKFEQGLAQGLTQARDEAAAALATAVEQAKAQALAEGLAQGKSEGMAEGLKQGIEQGKAEGERSAREAVAEEMAAQRVVFETAAHELQALISDPTKFFEPLKRLALHMAEQVVMGELHTSSKAIERLVQRCLDELDHPVHGAVVLELHPDDKARLQAQSPDLIQGMRLEAVPDMQPGSVRVFANDTVVEDLVENRLTAMARAMHLDEAAWLKRSVLTNPVSAEAPLVEEEIEATAVTEIKEVMEKEEEDGDVHS